MKYSVFLPAKKLFYNFAASDAPVLISKPLHRMLQIEYGDTTKFTKKLGVNLDFESFLKNTTEDDREM